MRSSVSSARRRMSSSLRAVGGDPARVDAGGLQVGGGLLQVVGLARGQHDARAGLAQRLGHLQAQAARAAGDERGLAARGRTVAGWCGSCVVSGLQVDCAIGAVLGVLAAGASGRRSARTPAAATMPPSDDQRSSRRRGLVRGSGDAQRPARTGRRRSGSRSSASSRAQGLGPMAIRRPPRASSAQVGSRRLDDAEPGADLRQLVVEEVAAARDAAGRRRQRGCGVARERAQRRRRARSRRAPRGRRPAGRARRWPAPRRDRRWPRPPWWRRRRCCSASPSALACSASCRPLDGAFDRRVDARGQQLRARGRLPSRTLRPSRSAPGCRACPRGSCSGGCRASTARPGSRACSRSRRAPGSPAVGLQAPLAGPALGDRRQHLEQQARLVGGLGRRRCAARRPAARSTARSASAPSQ